MIKPLVANKLEIVDYYEDAQKVLENEEVSAISFENLEGILIATDIEIEKSKFVKE